MINLIKSYFYPSESFLAVKKIIESLDFTDWKEDDNAYKFQNIMIYNHRHSEGIGCYCDGSRAELSEREERKLSKIFNQKLEAFEDKKRKEENSKFLESVKRIKL